MSHDIVIRGGSVADGTGADPVPADVAIDGDIITEVGHVADRGSREIDAGGRLVTPGFVDIHTHLDAQLAWDPIGSSSCWHGVTSVVLGNCGVTFAPCKPADRRYLAELMESVEDIPADSIMEGLDWSWETYGEYLDAMERWPKGLNTGGMVGHCAVRYHAMGERSLDPGPASDDDIAAMCLLVDEAIGAGALGFSTSRTPLHRTPDRQLVPGSYAAANELSALADVLRHRGRGIFEAVPAFIGTTGSAMPEVDLMTEIALASGRPVTFVLTQAADAPGRHREVLEAAEKAQPAGAQLWPQTATRGVGIVYGAVNRTPFDRAPAWRALRDLDLAGRLAVMADPGGRSALIADAEAASGRVPLDSVYVMPAGDARYEYWAEDSLAAHARRRGVGPAEAFIDLALESDGLALMVMPFLNDDLGAVEDMLRSPATLIGLADAGAHVGQIIDASQSTYYLSHWVRDREISGIGEAVRRLTSLPADLFGIKGRGVLRPGGAADLNVIDLSHLRLPQPEYVHDFPGGAGRFVQRSRGYDYTIVNGEVFMDHGEHTGALAGRMLRS